MAVLSSFKTQIFFGRKWNDAAAAGFLRNAHSLYLGVTAYEWIGKDKRCGWRSTVCFSNDPVSDRPHRQARSRHCPVAVRDCFARPFLDHLLHGHGLLLP